MALSLKDRLKKLTPEQLAELRAALKADGDADPDIMATITSLQKDMARITKHLKLDSAPPPDADADDPPAPPATMLDRLLSHLGA